MGLRHTFRTTPLAAVIALVGMCVAIAGAVWWLVLVLGHHRSAHALLLVVVGFVLELMGPWLHDRWHLGRGEAPHAMWGEGETRRPGWLGGPRRPAA